MQHVEISRLVALEDASEAYLRLSRIEDYPRLTDAVRSVVVRHLEDGTSESDWEVSFRDGLLRWSEVDHYDEGSRALRFALRDGDFEAFSGEWSVAEHAGGCRVTFRATFDLGMASLAELIEPLAERILRENLHDIMDGLFGAAVDEPVGAGG